MNVTVAEVFFHIPCNGRVDDSAFTLQGFVARSCQHIIPTGQ